MLSPGIGPAPRYTISHTRPTAPLILPEDEAAHYWAQLEWWYYVGHLKRDNGDIFGFELAFFKRITNEDHVTVLKVPLYWLRNVGMVSHFAVTDLTDRKFSCSNLTNLFHSWRAHADGYSVAINGWSACDRGGTHRLRARMSDYEIDLELKPTKSAVLHGENGIVEKIDGAANYHYSNTNMRAEGTVTVNKRPVTVKGKAWLDHEYGTISVDMWDWFCIQLEDNSELMVYAIRGSHSGHTASYGNYVDRDGVVTRLDHTELTIVPKEHWHSHKTGVDYPVAWRIEVQKLGLRLDARALLLDQELVVKPLTYWDGIIGIDGVAAGRPVKGYGYAELVGYGNSRVRRRFYEMVFKNVAGSPGLTHVPPKAK